MIPDNNELSNQESNLNRVGEFVLLPSLRRSEAKRMANNLTDAFGTSHFNFSKAFKALLPLRHGSYAPVYRDRIEGWMRDLVYYGLVVETKGPRGGKGWTVAKESKKQGE